MSRIEISGRSAVGSAPRSGRGGRWFKSSRPDQYMSKGNIEILIKWGFEQYGCGDIILNYGIGFSYFLYSFCVRAVAHDIGAINFMWQC